MRALVTAPPTLYEKVRTQTDAAGLYERRSVRVKRRKERKAARRKAARQQDQSGKRARKRLGELTWRTKKIERLDLIVRKERLHELVGRREEHELPPAAGDLSLRQRKRVDNLARALILYYELLNTCMGEPRPHPAHEPQMPS